MTTIANNLQQVNDRISQACQAAGRARETVSLLAVSKTFGAAAVAEAAAAGQRAFGENYIQEGVDKILALREMVPYALQWHCIGPIQSNKTRLVAEHFDWVHTVDRLKIAQRLSDQRPAHLPPLNVCIQVNVDGGDNKAGVPPKKAFGVGPGRGKTATVAAARGDEHSRALSRICRAKAVHEAAHALFERIRVALAAHADAHSAPWDTLSMGMTADLDAAIQAGSTMVRVGTGVFGARTYPAA